jgi:hypothetical protein
MTLSTRKLGRQGLRTETGCQRNPSPPLALSSSVRRDGEPIEHKRNKMNQSIEQKDKILVLEAFETLFNNEKNESPTRKQTRTG